MIEQLQEPIAHYTVPFVMDNPVLAPLLGTGGLMVAAFVIVRGSLDGLRLVLGSEWFKSWAEKSDNQWDNALAEISRSADKKLSIAWLVAAIVMCALLWTSKAKAKVKERVEES